jgi:hypothetical protein
MTTYTLNDLLYAKGTSEPVRQMLLAMAEKIERLEARLAQPEKEWVGLTEDEILEEYRQSYGDDGNLTDVYFARAIEARLKEKNG